MAGTKTKFVSSSSDKHSCEYCAAEFVKATTLAAHNCEPKRRMAQQNEVGVRLGYHCFQRFFNFIQPNSAEKSYRDFVDSPYYLAFVKFGRYCVEIRAISPEEFCNWLIRGNKKLDQWTRDRFYEEFLVDYLLREPAAPALERSIETMTGWAEEKQSRYQDYFKYATNTRICFDIQRGRISSWMIYTTQSGLDFLNRLNDKEISTIWIYIDSDRWSENFERRAVDLEWAKEVARLAGI